MARRAFEGKERIHRMQDHKQVGRPMSKWYVVQVEVGREDQTLAQIERAAAELGGSAIYDEVFVPKRTLFERKGREYVKHDVPLFPGYLIAVADRRNLGRLAQALRCVFGIARLLSRDGVCLPLADEEVGIICSLSEADGRNVGVSEGFIEGGQVVVVSGPLVGREVMIKKINRRKRTALVEFAICGRSVETELALALMKKNKEIYQAKHARKANP